MCTAAGIFVRGPTSGPTWSRWQAAYSAVVGTALRRRVARCVFVFARTTGAVEREIHDLEPAMAELDVALDPTVTEG